MIVADLSGFITAITNRFWEVDSGISKDALHFFAKLYENERRSAWYL